jgi:hypothetical protein
MNAPVLGRWGKAAFFLGALLIVAPCAAHGDDGSVELIRGGAQLRSGENPDISMDSETVRIALGRKSYIVDATFYFFNHGESTRVAVGFPEVGSAGGVIDATYELLSQLRLKNFETWVDGVAFEVKDVPGEVFLDGKKTEYRSVEDLFKNKLEPEKTDYAEVKEVRWLVKEVPFGGHRKTAVRVRYRTQTGVDGNPSHADYIYGTGRSWKGPIGKIQFVIQASSEAGVDEIDFARGRSYKVSRLGEYECAYVLTDVKPEENEKLRVHFSASPEPWRIRDSYDAWEYASSPVKEEFLDTLSRAQLRLLRNTFFAGHGRTFDDPELQRHFDLQSAKNYGWYRPRADFKETDLSPVERDNVRRIKAYEDNLARTLNPN